MGPVEVLEDIISPGSAASRLLQNIKNNAERMLKLTTDLLEFRKSDSGYTQLKISRVNVVLFSRQVFEKFTDLAQEKQIDFSFNCAEKNIPIYLDSHYMEIVLTNLLSNAIKFAPKGGKVSISLIQNKDETIDIITCDNGLGISQESHEKIFTSFYQADGVDEKHVGSGIGLAFSKNLVELHGGKLYFRCGVNADTQERETCFIINLQCGLRHFNDSSLIDEKNLNNVL
jgi:signal transduction histidine kinase